MIHINNQRSLTDKYFRVKNTHICPHYMNLKFINFLVQPNQSRSMVFRSKEQTNAHPNGSQNQDLQNELRTDQRFKSFN